MSGEKGTAAYRAELARQQPSPEIYLASAIVDGSPLIWPGSIVVKKPDDARRSVDEIKASDQAKCQALFAQFRGNNTWQAPTLAVLRICGLLNESKLTSDPRLAYIGKKSRERWQERIQPQLCIWNNSQFQFARSIFAADQRLLGAMFRAGVPIMAGTDAMNPFCFPGFSLLDELAMMADSGLTPLAVLQSATINPAKFLARDESKLNAKDCNLIEPGKIANLVLLRADPLADIHNTTKIQAVWLRGKYFDQAAKH